MFHGETSKSNPQNSKKVQNPVSTGVLLAGA
jgi:hypothetical protein